MVSTVYVYGMRLRGFSLGCQPMQGFVERQDDPTGKYHDLLVYDRKLTDKELADYELDSLTEPKQKYIEWELENLPGVYDKPRCDEFIDRQTLTHVICNVDCPEDIDHGVFVRVIQEIANSLDLFPWFKGEIESSPRVMTLEEVKEAIKHGGRLFTECEKEMQWVRWGSAKFSRPIDDDECRITFTLESDGEPYIRQWHIFFRNYNKTWRCWTKTPTLKQMDAEPWSDATQNKGGNQNV